MNQIKSENKQKKGFTIAEVLVVMAILGIFAIAAAATFTKKQQRPSAISPHGQFECYVKADGKVYQKTTIEKNAQAEQQKGDVGTPTGVCSFTPPTSKVAYYMVALVGGGGSGSNNNGSDPSKYDYGAYQGEFKAMFFPEFTTPPITMSPGAKGVLPASGGLTGGKGGTTYFNGTSLPADGGIGGVASTVNPGALILAGGSTTGDVCDGKVIFSSASSTGYLCVDSTDMNPVPANWTTAGSNCTAKGMHLPIFTEPSSAYSYGYNVCDASYGDDKSEVCALYSAKNTLGLGSSYNYWSGTLHPSTSFAWTMMAGGSKAADYITAPNYAARCVKTHTLAQDNDNTICDSPNVKVGNLCVTPTDLAASTPVATLPDYQFYWTNGYIPFYYGGASGNYYADYWAPAMAACASKGSVWRVPTSTDFVGLYNNYISGGNLATMTNSNYWSSTPLNSTSIRYCPFGSDCTTSSYSTSQYYSGAKYRCVKDYASSASETGDKPTAAGLISTFSSYVSSGGYTFSVSKSGDGGNAKKAGNPGAILIVW